MNQLKQIFRHSKLGVLKGISITFSIELWVLGTNLIRKYLKSAAILRQSSCSEVAAKVWKSPDQMDHITSTCHTVCRCHFVTLTHWSLGNLNDIFRYLILQIISVIGGWGISCELALRWTSIDLTDDKSSLVQVMAWRRHATSHYPNQCWPRSPTLYGFTRPQWVNLKCMSHPMTNKSGMQRTQCKSTGICSQQHGFSRPYCKT